MSELVKVSTIIFSNFPHYSFGEFILILETRPLLTLKFLIPTLIILIYSLILAINYLRNKVDKEPQPKQAKESFLVPMDNINKEMEFVQNLDYDHFESQLENSSAKIRVLSKSLRKKARKYRRMKYKMSFTASERKKQNLSKKMGEQFEDLVKIYGGIQRATLDMDLTQIGGD
jgi:hypothetical protein